MSRLSKLYQTMENLKDLGLSINEDLIQEANELEEEIIKKEILPVLSKTIEPALQPVKRELVLVVDYMPGQPLSVHLSRKQNFAAELTDAIEISPKRQHIVTATDIKRSTNVNFKVKFADGYICEGNGKDTFIDALKHMNLSHVATFNGRTFADFPLVGHRQRITEDHYKWQERVDGWWVYVNMSNETKVNIIEQVAKFLGIAVEIEISGKKVFENKEKDTIHSFIGEQSMSKRTTALEKSLNNAIKGLKKNSLNSIIRELKLHDDEGILQIFGCSKYSKKDEIRNTIWKAIPLMYNGKCYNRITTYARVDNVVVTGFVFKEISDWFQVIKIAAKNIAINHMEQVILSSEDIESFHYTISETEYAIDMNSVEFVSKQEYTDYCKKVNNPNTFNNV